MTDRICEIINEEIEGIDIKLELAELTEARRGAKGELCVEFATKLPVTDSLKASVTSIVSDNLPKDLEASLTVKLRHIYYDAEELQRFIKNIFGNRFRPVFSSVDVSAFDYDPDGMRIRVKADEAVRGFIAQNDTVRKIRDALRAEYCEEFDFDFTYGKVLSDVETVADGEPTVRSVRQLRVFKPFNRMKIFGGLVTGDASYIIDVEQPQSSGVLCGKISYIQSRETKTGLRLLSFTLTDYTAYIRCTYFIKDSDKDWENLLANGMTVVVSGEIRLNDRSGKYEITCRRITKCELIPESEFKPAPLPSLPPPDKYVFVQPQKVVLARQSSMFDSPEEFEMPSELTDKEYVVFDTETTGLYFDLDRIIEIAAVRLVGGRQVESFHTLIDPERSIPVSATEVNNITDEMVRGMPTEAQVIPEFFKFTRGAVLVAHNAEFDIRFVQCAAKRCGYYFDNKIMDTLLLARERLRGVANYKQGTIASAFGIDKGEAHRALDDTLTCAEIFRRLMSMKN